MKIFKSFLAIALLFALLICTSILPVYASAETKEIITFSYVNPLYPDTVVQPTLYSSSNRLLAADNYYSLEEAGTILRDAMEARTPVITVGYVVAGTSHSSTQISDYAEDIFDEATKHTGVPTEGDYLLWHFSSYSGSVSRYTESGKTYITYTYNMTYLSTASQEQQMNNAVNNLLSNLNVAAANNYIKVRTVYDYICENITYDTIGLRNGDPLCHTAYAALIKNEAVCQGYASLFYRLALTLGVDARLIAGYGSGGRHGWNIVELSGKYYNLDSTWDATLCQASMPYEYFLKAEANFQDHERFDEYNTATFHNEYPMSLTDYDPSNVGEDEPTPPITNSDSGYCGNDVTWQLNNNGVLQIRGNGAMTSAPWTGKTIRKVDIGNGVTTICSRAFENCTQLETVLIPESVVQIGEHAFEGCAELSQVLLPSNLQWIDRYAFADCYSLYQVGFAGCVNSIGDYAFSNCRALTYIKIPNNTNTIGEGAFSGCSWLQTIELADTITQIYNSAFADCTRLVTVKLPNSLSAIFNDCFKNCTSLEEVTIPNSVTAIGTNAFKNCNNLTNIYYNGSTTQWKQISISIGNTAITNATLFFVHKNGWAWENGKWAYYENGAKLKNCWKEDSTGWCYLGSDGYMRTNAWIMDSQGWCYVGDDGYCVTNAWMKDSYGWCYLNAEGRMATNSWIMDSQGWCYVGADGYCVTNSWMKDSHGWCYLNAEGRMATNCWVMDSVGWCYVGADGYAVTNCWKQDSHGWCYLNSEGSMTKSDWVYDGGWYYLDGNGYMVTGWQYIGGVWYNFASSGIWIG